jgi:hypothetical protein
MRSGRLAIALIATSPRGGTPAHGQLEARHRMSRLGPRISPAAAAPVSPCGCPPQDDSQRPGAGLKPTAGLGAAVGLLAGGPVGALFGAAASVLTSRKNNVAGATVRTAAKAAGAMWGVGSQAASKVEAGPVGDVVKTGLRCPPPPRTKWTRRVPHPVRNGHAASLTPY